MDVMSGEVDCDDGFILGGIHDEWSYCSFVLVIQWRDGAYVGSFKFRWFGPHLTD